VSVLWIAVALIALQRIWALIASARNTRRLLQRGGRETGAFQFPLIAALQVAWLAAMMIWVPAFALPNWWLFGAAAIAELLHTWTIVTLGQYWSTRVIVVPGTRLVRNGPYRVLRHPNYVFVAAEIVLLPLSFHAFAIAAVFALAYVALILWRLRDENCLLATLVAAALLSGCAGAGAGAHATVLPKLASLRPDTLGKIQHVVIIIQENRSFDNLFAGWPNADAPRYGWNGGRKIPLYKTTFLTGKWDLPHSFQEAIRDYDHGRMDGFGRVMTSVGRAAFLPYAYLAHSEIKPYRTMAKEYTLLDHMFPTEFGSSFTAHLDLIAGTTNLTPQTALVNMPSASPWGCDAPPGTFTQIVNSARVVSFGGPFPCLTQFRTLADELDAHVLSWNYYEPPVFSLLGAWSAFDAIEPVREGPDWTYHVLSSEPQTKILSDAASGQLANVVWVTPDKLDSDHSGSNSDTGPSWVAAVVNAIGESPYWNSTVIVLLWDEWGGWYDNVAPPQRSFLGRGIRVPCILISPYAHADYVDHTVYSYGSVLKLIEQTFHLPELGPAALGYTDGRANSLATALDLNQTPRAFVPIPAKYPPAYFVERPPSYLPPDTE
jgi:phospholipase C/isoprenylcysteine carboxyl methyltransferase (ICMT) family protein YpbQ